MSAIGEHFRERSWPEEERGHLDDERNEIYAQSQPWGEMKGDEKLKGILEQLERDLPRIVSHARRELDVSPASIREMGEIRVRLEELLKQMDETERGRIFKRLAELEEAERKAKLKGVKGEPYREAA